MSESGPSIPSVASIFSLDWLSSPQHRSLFHPTSGMWILALDWMIFGGNALTLGLATLPGMLAGFLLGTLGTALCQWHFAADSPARALIKGLFGGLLVGVPLPIAGSFAGTVILAVSGLKSRRSSEGADRAARE